MAQRKRPVRTNLALLKKSRRAPRVGDVFALSPRDGLFLFGRVVETDANPLGVGGAVLIYIYRRRAAEMSPVPELRPDELLVPPMMTNRLPWSRGYFEHLENRPLLAADRLPQHCFLDDVRGGHRDEFGKSVPEAVGPVGDWALQSFRTIDDEISRALGIPLVPED